MPTPQELNIPDKLDSILGTKQAIREAIVSKGTEVPEGTTFRQYADLIAGISAGTASNTQTVTLLTSGWAASEDGRYQQTVSVESVSSDTAIIIADCDLTGTENVEDKIAILEAWQQGPSVFEVTQGTGTLTFYAVEAPTIDIPVNVGVI